MSPEPQIFNHIDGGEHHPSIFGAALAAALRHLARRSPTFQASMTATR